MDIDQPPRFGSAVRNRTTVVWKLVVDQSKLWLEWLRLRPQVRTTSFLVGVGIVVLLLIFSGMAAAVPMWMWRVTGIIAVAVLAGAAWWWVPKRQMKSITASDPKDRADIEDNFRKTIGQALGGIAVLFGAVIAYMQLNEQRNQLIEQRNATQEQQKAAHDLLISNQVARGFEQLSSDKVAMRLGGIYALGAAMNNSSQYHQAVLEALCAFVRDRTAGMIIEGPPATDIQAALSVIGGRGPGAGHIDLRAVRVPKAYLVGADLRGADLSGADMSGANVSGADFRFADLIHADLSDAYLMGTNLRNAKLMGIRLDRACGWGDDLVVHIIPCAHYMPDIPWRPPVDR